MKFFLVAFVCFYSYAVYSGPCSRNASYCQMNGISPSSPSLGCELGNNITICKALPFESAVCEEKEFGQLVCNLSAPTGVLFPEKITLVAEVEENFPSLVSQNANIIDALSLKCHQNSRCSLTFNCSFYLLPDSATEEHIQFLIQQIEGPSAIKPKSNNACYK